MSIFERLCLDSMSRTQRMRTRAQESAHAQSEREEKVLRATSRLVQRQKTEVILPTINHKNLSSTACIVAPIDNSFKFSSFPKRKFIRIPTKKSNVVHIPSNLMSKEIKECTKRSSSTAFDTGVAKFPLPPPDFKEIAASVELVSHYGISLTRLVG